MTSFFRKWRKYLNESSVLKSVDSQEMSLTRLNPNHVFKEIEQRTVKDVMSVIHNAVDIDRSLSFSEMFGGAIRTTTPLESASEGEIGQIIGLLEGGDWQLDFGQGIAERKEEINSILISMNNFVKSFNNNKMLSGLLEKANEFLKNRPDGEGKEPLIPTKFRDLSQTPKERKRFITAKDIFLASIASVNEDAFKGRKLTALGEENIKSHLNLRVKDMLYKIGNLNANYDLLMSKSKDWRNYISINSMLRDVAVRYKNDPPAEFYAEFWPDTSEFKDRRVQYATTLIDTVLTDEFSDETTKLLFTSFERAPEIGKEKTAKMKIGKILQKGSELQDRFSNFAAGNPTYAGMFGREGLNDEQLRKYDDSISQAVKLFKKTDVVHAISTGGHEQTSIGELDLDDLVEFWNKKSAFFRENPEEAYGNPYTVLLSRHPVDVARMSDFTNISSCHQQGGEYFHCAVAEAKGHGPVAYVVHTPDLQKVLDNFGVESIEELDDEEIFSDRDRNISGIEPASRVRLRRFVNWENDTELALPELRVYGKRFPGFRNAVSEWARERQLDQFKDEEGKYKIPKMHSYTRYGGSYADTESDELFKDFFSPLVDGDLDKLEDEYGFRGDVSWEGEEDESESLVNEWAGTCAGYQDNANRRMEHASVWHEVMGPEEIGGGHPYVSFSGDMAISVDTTLVSADEINNMDWSEMREIMQDLEVLNAVERVYPTEVEMSASPGKDGTTIIVHLRYSEHDYDGTPDGFYSFIDYMEEAENNYEEVRTEIRAFFVEKEWVEKTEVDKYVDTLTDETESFKFFEWEYEQGELVFNIPLPGIPLGTMGSDLEDIFLGSSYDVNAKIRRATSDNRISILSKIFRKDLVDGLADHVEAMQKEAEKQLALDFDDNTQVELNLDDPKVRQDLRKKWMNFGGVYDQSPAQFTLHSQPVLEYETLGARTRYETGPHKMFLTIEFTLPTDAESHEMLAGIEFIKAFENHMDEVANICQNLIIKLYQAFKEGPNNPEKLLHRIRQVTPEQLVVWGTEGNGSRWIDVRTAAHNLQQSTADSPDYKKPGPPSNERGKEHYLRLIKDWTAKEMALSHNQIAKLGLSQGFGVGESLDQEVQKCSRLINEIFDELDILGI